MNDGWESDGESQVQYSAPIYNRTYKRGGGGDSHRRGRGRYSGDQQGGGRNNNWNNGQGNAQGNTGRFDRGSGRNQGRGNWRGKNVGNQGNGNWRDNSSGNQDGYAAESENGTTVNIKSSDVGKIIGRGGTKIRELQDQSGAHIQVSKL